MTNSTKAHLRINFRFNLLVIVCCLPCIECKYTNTHTIPTTTINDIILEVDILERQSTLEQYLVD